MYKEPESPNEGACLRYVMNRYHQVWSRVQTVQNILGAGTTKRVGGVFETHGEPESPQEGACIRYMVNRHLRMRGVLNMYDFPESPNQGA